MKTNSIIVFLLSSYASSLYGQANDSNKVKQITYERNSDKKEIVRVSAQQIKAKPYYDEGYSFVDNHKFANAIKSYKKAIDLDKAIELNKSSPEPYLSKSVLLMQQGKNELALKVLNSLIEFIPDYAMGYVQRGFLYNSTAKYEFALQDFKKYLEIIKTQNQEQNSAALVADIKKQIAEIEVKIKN